MDLETLGIYGRTGALTTTTEWEAVLSFIRNCFSHGTTQKMKSVKLLSGGMRDSLYAQPEVFALVSSQLNEANVFLEDETGELLTIA